MVMHHVPVERCADILESMSGIRRSDGWVHALLGHAARAVAAANTTIRALIILAGVICGDETADLLLGRDDDLRWRAETAARTERRLRAVVHDLVRQSLLDGHETPP